MFESASLQTSDKSVVNSVSAGTHAIGLDLPQRRQGNF
jgi:hypothetical protein